MSGTSSATTIDRRLLVRIVVICGFAYTFLGFDLTVYGATVPSLIAEWQLSPAYAGTIGSYLLVGMLFGALAVTAVVNRVGRKAAIVGCITLFSTTMALCAIAPSPGVFGVFRFLAGVGLGASLPPVMAYTMEYAPAGRRNVTYAIMGSGSSVGGALSAALAIPLIPLAGWRVMYVLCAIPVLLLVPAVVTSLPESLESLVLRGRFDDALRLAKKLGVAPPERPGEAARSGWLRGVIVLFARRHVRATLLFWLTMACALLLLWAMTTWLPQLMVESGYPLGSALSFLFVFYLGAIVGTLIGAVVADRLNPKPVVVVTFLAAVVAIVLAASTQSTIGLYAFFAIGGFGTLGTQILFEAHLLQYYPIEARPTGLGWAFGIGRIGGITGPILGGLLLTVGLPVSGIFLVFASVGLLGALAVGLAPRARVVAGSTGDYENETIQERQEGIAP